MWRIGLSQDDGTAVSLGPGVLLIGPRGEHLWLAPRAPKGRKVRSVRIDAAQPAQGEQERGETTRWEVAREGGLHPTQKPVELTRRALLNSTRPGEIVLDPFLGSGSTLIGAELTGRRCYGTESDPAYVDVMCVR